MSFGGKARVDEGRPEEIECGCCLGNEAAPQMDGKIGVNTGQAGKEVTFPSINSFFGGVSAMNVRRRKFVGNRDRLHVVFEALGAFVVHDFQDWFVRCWLSFLKARVTPCSLWDLLGSARITFES